MKRIRMIVAGLAFALMLITVGVQARADRVVFRFNGGAWSHAFHRGWHRYWGGPEIGFYYAPAPCYVVDGYPDAYYYDDSSFWYDNPSFGLGVVIGGGGGNDRDYHGGYIHRDEGRRSREDTRGGNFSGSGGGWNHSEGSNFHTGGGHSSGGHVSSGGHSSGRSGGRSGGRDRR